MVGDRALRWWVTKVQADEKAWVASHARARRLVWRVALWFLLVLAATGVRLWGTPGSPWDSAASLLLGAWAGVGCISVVRRGLSYRSGWLDGRQAMVASLAEAHRRGFSADEWAELELARDYAVLGVAPPSPPGTDVEPGG